MKSEFVELIAKKVALEDYFGDKVEADDVESDYVRLVGQPEDKDHAVFKGYLVSKKILTKMAEDFVHDIFSKTEDKKINGMRYIRTRAAESAFMLSNPDVELLEDAYAGYIAHVENFQQATEVDSSDIALPGNAIDPMKQQFAAEVKWLSSVLKIFEEGKKSLAGKGMNFYLQDYDSLIDVIAREGTSSLESATPQKHHVLFVLSETYQIVDEESSANGEAKETGFSWEDIDYTPDELSDYLSDGGFNEPSCSRDFSSIREWMSTYDEVDFHTGDTKTRSLHCRKVKLIDGTVLGEQKASRLWAYICNQHLQSLKEMSGKQEPVNPFMENIGYH